jgi:hypothetical protein
MAWMASWRRLTWIKKNTDESAVLATAYDPAYYLYTGRLAITPGFHKPASYFYPYGRAKPDVGLASTIKDNLTEVTADYLIIDRIAGFAEQSAQEETYDGAIKALSKKAGSGICQPRLNTQSLGVTVAGTF